MAKPTSREELIAYCLRALGAPVLQINIDETQLDDRVDEALQFYFEYHSDATIHHFRKHQLTEEDVNNKFIVLPEDLLFVSRILPWGYFGTRDSLFSVKYHIHLNDIYDLSNPGSLINYTLNMQHMSLISSMFDSGKHQRIRFNRHMNKLFIDTDWDVHFRVGDHILIEGYSMVDPEEYVDVYNDMFLKRYLTALIKKNWGINMKKFGNMQLPGGVTMNGQDIYQEAIDEIRAIEEEMQQRYEMPPIGFVG